MKSEDIAQRVVTLVAQVAPDVDAGSVLPEADYAQLASTNKCVKYLQARLD